MSKRSNNKRGLAVEKIIRELSTDSEFEKLSDLQKEEVAKQELMQRKQMSKPLSRGEFQQVAMNFNQAFQSFSNDLRGMWMEMSIIKELLFEKEVIKKEDFDVRLKEELEKAREQAKRELELRQKQVQEAETKVVE